MTSDVQNDHLNACAGIVYKGDPDRFRATMAAPLELREKLLPLYAFNVEVARAPWVTAEAIIAEMRLQWWHDALGEIATGAEVRRHEVVTPLAALLTPKDAKTLQKLVEARRWDIYKDRFESKAALWAHLHATSASLMEVALNLAGQQTSSLIAGYCEAVGLAGWFGATAALKAQGCAPLPDEAPEALVLLAQEGLAKCKALRHMPPPKRTRSVLLSGWQAEPLLRRVVKTPSRVFDGSLALNPVQSRVRLAAKAAIGSF